MFVSSNLSLYFFILSHRISLILPFQLKEIVQNLANVFFLFNEHVYRVEFNEFMPILKDDTHWRARIYCWAIRY